MKIRTTLIAFGVTIAVAGCGTIMDTISINDEQVIELSDKSCKQMDSDSKVAAANSKYTARLNKIAKNLGNNANGIPLNYKVYQTNDVNAWAMANGCVRVYSGLMDTMTDDEVQGVLGHEIGHVALGHSKKAMQTAYAATLARGVAGQFGGAEIAAISNSQLADLTENLINAQFSQSQETQSDDYSYNLLKERKLNINALVTAFEKLASGGKPGDALSKMFSSHPDAQGRADRIRARIKAEK